MPYYQNPEDTPMTADQEIDLRDAIQDIFRIVIDDNQLLQICDALMIGYPPSVQEDIDDAEATSIVWEYIRLAKEHGCSSLQELLDEKYPIIAAEYGTGEVSDGEQVFHDSILDYYEEHLEMFEGAFES